MCTHCNTMSLTSSDNRCFPLAMAFWLLGANGIVEWVAAVEAFLFELLDRDVVDVFDFSPVESGSMADCEKFEDSLAWRTKKSKWDAFVRRRDQSRSLVASVRLIQDRLIRTLSIDDRTCLSHGNSNGLLVINWSELLAVDGGVAKALSSALWRIAVEREDDEREVDAVDVDWTFRCW